jgi:tetratricopeptide (TPR) repeat protein
MVLPPVHPAAMPAETGAAFQWHLTDQLNKCRYYEMVPRMEYELYCRDREILSTAAVPDSLLRDMLAWLGAQLVARTRLDQPGGKFTAEVTYTIPADELTGEDYAISSGVCTETDPSRSWNLAGKCIDKLVDERIKAYRIIDARQAYGEVIHNPNLNMIQLAAYQKQALESCQQLVKQEPRNKLFRYMEAVTLLDIYKQENAIAKFQAILDEIDPDHLPTHERLAGYYFNHGNLEKARGHYARLTELEPDNFAFAAGLAGALAGMERAGEAASVYEKLAAMRDTDPEVRHWLAGYYRNQAEKEKSGGNKAAADSLLGVALENLTRSCELTCAQAAPGDSEWVELYCQRLNFLAMVQREIGGAGSEVETLRRIVELDRSMPGALYNLAVYEHQAGNFDKALELYTEALVNSDPARKSELQYQIGVINLKQFGRYPEAIAALSQAVETRDVVTRELAFYLRGLAYYSVAGSVKNGGTAITLNDSTSAALSGRGPDEQAGFFFERALEDFRRVSPENVMLAESVRQHIASIEKERARLGRRR